MKIALISDVHANFFALQAVVKDAKVKGAQEFWNLGDAVGYSPFPNETIALLRRLKAKSILGNYDQKILCFAREGKKWKKDKNKDKYFSFAWTTRHLSWWHKRYLKRLPEQLEIQREGVCFLLVHGSPARIDEGLSMNTSCERLAELARSVKAQAVLCGHSHGFFDREINGVRFINPGSVGRSFDGDPRASYVMLEGEKGFLLATHYRVDYPVEKNLVQMHKDGFPSILMDSIRLGQSVDTLAQEKVQRQEEKILKEVLSLAESCQYDQAHAHQVCRLSLMLFDALMSLHQLGDEEKFLLRCGALLHDIGWVEGGNRHHKTSRDLIFRAADLSLRDEDKVIVALLARYHRRSLPSLGHKLYGSLSKEKRKSVHLLASLLRIADGLDATHQHLVQEVQCMVDAQGLKMEIISTGDIEAEIKACYEKADFFKKFFKKEIFFKRKVG